MRGAAKPRGARRYRHVCLYAIVSGASGPLRAEGAAGEKLSRVRVAGLDLVVGALPTARPGVAILRRYDASIRQLMNTHASLLPARFGTCAPTLEELSAAVTDRRAALRRALRSVRHRVQMTVRVLRPTSGSDRGQTGVRPGSDPGYGATRGRRFLQQRAAELQVPGTDGVRAAVSKWVRAERVERCERGRLAGTLYHLVPRGAAPDYRRALERSALETNLTVVISGPWPPYAFAEDAW